MECHPLDVTIVSADGIKNVNWFSRMDAYAVVKLIGLPKKNNKKKTNVDKKSGTAPKWNYHMKFIVPDHSLKDPTVSLLIQIKADRIFGSSREVGEVNVPVSELYNAASSHDSVRKTVEYQVRKSSGRPKGTLKFCYRFGEKFVQDNQFEPTMKSAGEEPVTAYPAPSGYPQQYPQMGYAMPPHGYQYNGGYAAPPPGYGGYPPTGYPQGTPNGYGYPPGPGYGYAPMQPAKKKKGGMGMGLGMGLVGGLLVGDMIGEAGEMAAYDEGYNDAMGMDF